MSRLTKIRGGHRACCTTLIDKLIVAILSESSTGDISTMRIELERQRDKVLQYDIDVLEEIDEDKIQEEITSATTFNMKVTECLRSSNDYLASKTSKFSSPSLQSTSPKQVKLPVIKLPTFSGNPLEWQPFWDLFNSQINSRSDLADSSKFYYLNTQLTGEAALLMAGFKHTDAEYIEAVELLRQTYGKPKKQIESRLHAVFDLKSPDTTSTSLSKFRSLYEGHLRGLRTLGVEIDRAGYVFAALIIRKLPIKVRDNINREGKSDYWELESLRAAINNEIGHLQSLEASSNSTRSSEQSCDVFPENSYGGTASFPVAADATTNTCHFCKGSHSSVNCTKFVSSSDRQAEIVRRRLCFNCLRHGHSSNACTNYGRCTKCRRKHHTAICTKDNSDHKRVKPASAKTINPPKSSSTTSAAVTTTSDETSATSSTSAGTTSGTATGASTGTATGTTTGASAGSSTAATTAATVYGGETSHRTSVALSTALITVRGGNTIHHQRALLDLGSQTTFITESLATSMNTLPVRSTSLKINGFGGKLARQSYNVVAFDVVIDSSSVIPVEAIVVKSLPNSIVMPGRSHAVKELKDIGHKLADPSDVDSIDDISILIGADQYYKFMFDDASLGDLHIIPSKLGDLLSGILPVENINSDVNVDMVSVFKVASRNESDLDVQLEKLWSMDSIGICSDLKTNESLIALDKFNNSLRYDGEKYMVSLPWRFEDPKLPDNYYLSKRRLFSVVNSMKSKGSMLDKYDSLINNELERDFIEPVPNPQESFGRVTYLPHHGVLKESSTTPLRIVFDCSAKENSNKFSLNDCLYSGPPLMTDIIELLLKFRLHANACVADIEKAFLQVGLSEHDRDATRFLWLENPYDVHSKILVYRFKVVLFGATCSQFLLNACIKEHLRKVSSETAEILDRSLYVDNLVCSLPSKVNLNSFYDDARKIMSDAGFNLRQWVTNSPDLNSHINDDQANVESCDTDTKVLGLIWSSTSDILSFPQSNIIYSRSDTKRSILSSISKIYDPLGALLPVTISSRMFMQELWKTNLKWDETLPDNLSQRWQILSHNLNKCTGFTLPRSVNITSDEISLHAFCDSSTKGYGTVLYLVQNGRVHFLIARAKVVPIKSPSLPQLELTSINLGARLISFVSGIFKDISTCSLHIWSDSEISLCWLSSQKILKPYVKNRVDNIHSLVPEATFHHVKSADNPADLISRGMSAKHFLKSKLWLNGPAWLGDGALWIPFVPDRTNKVSCIVASDEQIAAVEVSSNHVSNQVSFVELFISKFSSHKRMIRIFSCLLQSVQRFKDLISLGGRRQNNPDSSVELSIAENLLISLIQRENYPEIYSFLETGKGKMPPLVRQHKLRIIDGIIRCMGRLQYSSLSYNAKYPILLPPHNHFTKLIIVQMHMSLNHAGLNYMVGAIRERFWIPRTRQRVRSIIRLCVTCNRHNSRPYTAPCVPPYPLGRVSDSKPFAVIGVDYTGALQVKDHDSIVKVYICLFTCASTRAIHLELVEDNSAEAFIKAFRRFVSRRSCPSVIISDNATTFKSASLILYEISKSPVVTSEMRDRSIQWKFIPARSPWHGGFYERMIGLTKNSLKKILGNSLLSYIELYTVVTEVESILNCRPLTYSSDDIEDSGPITPSHLLCGFRLDSIPERNIDLSELNDPSVCDRQMFTKRELRCRLLIQHFHKRWQSEYLLALRERNCNLDKNVTATKIPKIGDVVLIHDECPRLRWKLGRIVSLDVGIDGLVRSAQVATKLGTVSRSILKLYPLEVSVSEKFVDKIDDNVVPDVRPKRKAALEAAQKIALDAAR